MENHHPSHTTLRRRMIVQLGLMVVCSLLMGVGAFVGINGLHQDFGVAVQGYRQLRQIYEVGLHVATAKDALAANPPAVKKAIAAIETAQLQLDLTSRDGSPDSSPYWLDESRRKRCADLLQQALIQLKTPPTVDDRPGLARVPAINDLLGELANLSAEIRTTITSKQEAADRRRHFTLILITSLSAGVVLIAIAVGVRQYRGVVNPLDRLGRSVRNFAAGRFSDRIAIESDREFAALADDFNHMADELEGLYRDLEQKVDLKSKELARSQRLASVGFLAAGVAHEINNPLSIITGYAERLLELLDREADDATAQKTRKTIRIICEEAFRCKEITDRLLSLARPGSQERRPESLRSTIEEVIQNIAGAPQYASRRITFASDPERDFTALAKLGEMKQVTMNLLMNALEAVETDTGHVHLALTRNDQEIVLEVTDNGRGMTSATLDRIFEPFYTEKRGDRPGIGLGLSITHAIIIDHGGRITAESDGVGRGSRFVVRLPAAQQGAELVSR